MMSRRGKYWDLPDQIKDQPSHDPSDSGPISIRVDSTPADSDRPTMPAPTATRENLQTKEPENTPPQTSEDNGNKTVENTRDTWRREKILATAWLSLLLGAGIGTLLMHQTKKGIFAPEESTVVETPPKNTEEEKYTAPIIIQSNEDLKAVLEKENIRVTPEDFNFDTGRPALHAKVLRLVVENEESDQPQFRWKPVIPTPGKANIEQEIKQPQLLVAVQIINPYGQQFIEKVVNPGPSAHRYIARTPDPDDPNIVYFYFDRCANPKQAHALARIRIQDPEKPKNHVWYQSFDIPKCTAPTNSVESDE